MKIALIGAQGVGKTSLSRALFEKVPNSYIVRETVRECPYPCDQGADFKTEWWVLSHSILAEQEAREMKKDLIITDRCLLDIAVYTKLIHEGRDGRITDIQRAMIERTIQDWFEEDPYDYVFFIKVKPEIWKTRDLDDGFRSLDMGWYNILTTEFEKAIDRLGTAQKSRVHVLENNGSFTDSFNQIMGVCSRDLPSVAKASLAV